MANIINTLKGLPADFRERRLLSHYIKNSYRAILQNMADINELDILYRAQLSTYSDEELGFGINEKAEKAAAAAFQALDQIRRPDLASWFLNHPKLSELNRQYALVEVALHSQIDLLDAYRLIAATEDGQRPIAHREEEIEAEAARLAHEVETNELMVQFGQKVVIVTWSFQELTRRQAEHSFTAGTQLDFRSVDLFYQAVIAEANHVAEMGEVPSEDILELLDAADEALRINSQNSFYFWAGEVARLQHYYDEVRTSFIHIVEDFVADNDFVPPSELVAVSDLLAEKIPQLWGQANWEGLKLAFGDAFKMAEDLVALARTFREWGEKILAVRRRMEKTDELRKRTESELGQHITLARSWINARSKFTRSANAAFAIGDWDAINHALITIEDPLKKYEHSVRNYRDLNLDLAGITKTAQNQAKGGGRRKYAPSK